MNKRELKRIALFGAATQVLCLQALAQGVTTPPSTTTVPALSTTGPDIPGLPKLSVLDPQAAPPDCNKEIMQNLNSQYLLNRSNARTIQYNNQMNGLVLTTPKANQMDCFQQAMQNIKNLMAAINTILAMFTMQPDMDAIMQQIIGMVLKAACQEINQVTGSISGSLNQPTNAINGTIGGISGTSVGVGSVTTNVATILNTGNNKGAGAVTEANPVSTNTSSLVNIVNAVNPFGSSK